MPQSLVQNYVHLVFSTKGRRPWFQSEEERQRLHAYLAGACRNLECPAFQVGGATDHVHIFFALSQNARLRDLVRDAKKESSKWLKREFRNAKDFHWQSGYAAFSISPAHTAKLKEYIRTQMEHHKKVSFQEELRRLLELYEVQYDERYVWD
ncbi:IS200/IS605 family transposase [bacterium]|nr:IS200/IS605 family transposase [bacterium]